MFNFLIINPLTNLLLGFYQLLGENFGLAVILFTIFVRVLLLPLTIRQIRLQKKIAELQPKLQEIQAQKKDASQMTPEELALMKQTASSCLGGILPFVIQIPLFLGLYNVINDLSQAKSGDVFNSRVYFEFLKYDPSYRFNTEFLGFDLARIPSQVGFNTQFIPFAILLALLVLTQLLQSKIMNSMQKARKTEDTKKKPNTRKLSREEQEKQQMQEEMQKMMTMQTTYILPLIIGVASYSFPAALGVYWLTQNVFAIVQMYVQFKGVKNILNYFKKNTTSVKQEKLRVVAYEDVEESKTENTTIDDEVKKVKSTKKLKNKKGKKKSKR